MKKLASAAVLVLTALFVTGCSDSTGSTSANYTLVAIDGHPVPASFNYVDGSTTVVSGSLLLTGGSYAVRMARISESGMITRPEHTEVSYHRTLIEPPGLRLVPVSCDIACTAEAIGQISGSTLTLTLTHPDNGTVYTYQRDGSM